MVVLRQNRPIVVQPLHHVFVGDVPVGVGPKEDETEDYRAVPFMEGYPFGIRVVVGILANLYPGETEGMVLLVVRGGYALDDCKSSRMSEVELSFLVGIGTVPVELGPGQSVILEKGDYLPGGGIQKVQSVFGADPDVSLAVFQYSPDPFVGESVFRSVAGELTVFSGNAPVESTSVASEIDGPVRGLLDAAYRLDRG